MSQGKKGSWTDHPIQFKNKKQLRSEIQKFFKLYPPDKYNLYFSPVSYSQPKRQKIFANTTKFLSQDIDENFNFKEPMPTILWESSDSKYQGLWELDRSIDTITFDKYNVPLAKKVNADDCFDLTHVFRIPGTINHKYKNKPKVSKAKINKPAKLYRVTKLKKELLLDNVLNTVKSSKKSKNKQSNLQERAIYAKYNIPQNIKNYLASPELKADWDRSKLIWMIENTLHEIGMSPQEIIVLIKNSVFNKYKGRHDEEKRLTKELMKIIENEMVEDSEIEPLNYSSYQKVMGNLKTFEGWLVKGVWGRNSHGIVAGMPKTFKSTMVHDLAVSVASGKDFLGRYEVLEQGPVIIIQNENADYIMKDRTEKMITSKGLTGTFESINDLEAVVKWAPELPLYFVNQEGFSLSDEKKKKALELLIEKIKPVLVIFDPLYLMFDGDINKAEDLNPALNWLLQLKNNYRTSIMLLHHYNKGGGDKDSKGGARMSGSIFLYGWIESAWYLTKEESDFTGEDEDEFKSMVANIQLRREFRMAGQFPDLDIAIDMGEIGDPYYRVEVQVSKGDNKPQEKSTVKDPVDEIKRVMSDGNVYTRRQLQKLTQMNRQVVRNVVENLSNQMWLEIIDGKYRRRNEFED